MNIKEDEELTVTLENGECVNANYVIISQVTFMGRDFFNFKFYITPEKEKNFSNLLGLNIFVNFNYISDNAKGVIEFYRIENPFTEHYVNTFNSIVGSAII